jgi:hypothetical protein
LPLGLGLFFNNREDLELTDLEIMDAEVLVFGCGRGREDSNDSVAYRRNCRGVPSEFTAVEEWDLLVREVESEKVVAEACSKT